MSSETEQGQSREAGARRNEVLLSSDVACRLQHEQDRLSVREAWVAGGRLGRAWASDFASVEELLSLDAVTEWDGISTFLRPQHRDRRRLVDCLVERFPTLRGMLDEGVWFETCTVPTWVLSPGNSDFDTCFCAGVIGAAKEVWREVAPGVLDRGDPPDPPAAEDGPVAARAGAWAAAHGVRVPPGRSTLISFAFDVSDLWGPPPERVDEEPEPAA